MGCYEPLSGIETKCEPEHVQGRGVVPTISLDAVRADGWFEATGQGIEHFDVLCQVLGPPFVALSLLGGIEIRSIQIHASDVSQSVIGFSVMHEDENKELTVGEFQRNLSHAFFANRTNIDALPHTELDERTSVDQVQRFLGAPYVLLAPIFGLRLEQLVLDASSGAHLRIRHADKPLELPLEAFRQLVHRLVQSELTQRAGDARTIDLSKVDEADSHWNDPGVDAATRADRVVSLLGPWVTSLSFVVRSGTLDHGPEVVTRLMSAMSLLAEAWGSQQRYAEAEEALRIGIQLSREEPGVGELYGQLGMVLTAQNKWGQAIGVLRRAVSLDGTRSAWWCALARAYHERGKDVAALSCVQQAERLRSNDPPNHQDAHHDEQLRNIGLAIRQRLGPSAESYANWMQSPSS
jgi:tetratricopeptide (TPR) repeat protein